MRGPGPDRALVFQNAGLYSWRTVAANVAFGLEVSRLLPRAETGKIVERQLALVGLSEFADHYPNELSGGMQQRVGLARAFAVSPGRNGLDLAADGKDAGAPGMLGRLDLDLVAHLAPEQRTADG
jgi:ABC-type taurine transport system ATPase subunit